MSADLQQLLDEAVMGHTAEAQTTPRQAIQRVNYSHDSMIDCIIAHPGISQNQLALLYGYSASWISQVMSSDAFQARLAERRTELVDPTILATIEEQFKGVVARSLEVIREKLKKPPDQIPDNLALRTLELSSRALGYGARDAGGPAPQAGDVNVHLNIMGERLVDLLRQKKVESLPDIEGEFGEPT